MNHCRVYMRAYLSLRLLATKVTSLSLYYLLYYRGCVAPHSTLSLSLSLSVCLVVVLICALTVWTRCHRSQAACYRRCGDVITLINY